MAELADALDLGSSVLDVQVQLLLLAPLKNLVGLWFNLLININSRKWIDFLLCKRKVWFNGKYIDVVNDMYNDKVLDDDDIEDLDLSKEKNDFER